MPKQNDNSVYSDGRRHFYFFKPFRYIDVVVADNSRPVWSRDGSLSAIICDPPYGIREPTTRVGTTKDNVVITEDQLAHHIPQKVREICYL